MWTLLPYKVCPHYRGFTAVSSLSHYHAVFYLVDLVADVNGKVIGAFKNVIQVKESKVCVDLYSASTRKRL